MKDRREYRLPNLNDNNPNNWRGIFYVNRKDKRIIVPKQDSTQGWTLNFGNPYAYVLIGVFAAIIVAYSFLT